MMTEQEIHVALAFLIIGEGCLDVQVSKYKGEDKYYKPRLRVCMTEHEPLELLASTFKPSYIGHRVPTNTDRESWSVEYVGLKAVTLIHAVLPYLLSSKLKQANVLLKLWDKEIAGSDARQLLKQLKKDKETEWQYYKDKAVTRVPLSI